MAIFGNKDKSGNATVNFSSVPDSIPGIPGGLGISATIADGNLVIRQRLGKHQPVLLPLHRIRNFGTVAESEIVAQQKSVVGRAAVGGLLLGPLGAVIGGIDGAGSKQKKVNRFYWVVNYDSSDGEGMSTISMEVVGATLGLKKFEKTLAEACPNYGVQEKREPTVL